MLKIATDRRKRAKIGMVLAILFILQTFLSAGIVYTLSTAISSISTVVSTWRLWEESPPTERRIMTSPWRFWTRI